MSKRTQQRQARQRVEQATKEAIDRHISLAFTEGIETASRETPKSHSGHFIRMFGRLLKERADEY